MKKLNTAPISGMQELLPAEQATFDQLKRQISQTFKLHGFQNIETPTIDRTEILCAKAGGDTEKQIYKVVKTVETASDADQALRFDHTVPLARYVVEHQNDLAFPFKVTQIGRNFRGERAQKGRFREFYQCDVDIVGRSQLPLAYDAEVIATLFAALQTFLTSPMRIRLSNRKILSGLLSELNLVDHAAQLFNIIDHAEKISPEQTKSALFELGLLDDQIKKLTDFMAIRGSRAQVVLELRKLGVNHQEFRQGVEELEQVMQLLEAQNLGDYIVADMLIIRGLDYYTGTVFETLLVDYPRIGSVCSGGRYDNLASHYTDQLLPGVGGSIGLTRLFYVLNENNLLKNQVEQPLEVAIVPISSAEYDFCFKLAAKLRLANRSVDLILLDKKLSNKLTYAAKIARHAIVVGENEAKSGQIVVKDLTSGALMNLDEYL